MRSSRRVGPFQSGAGYRQALGRARDEAFERNDDAIRLGHILLGVALTPDARADAMLAELHVTRTDLADRAAAALGAALPPNGGGPDLPFTARSVGALSEAALLAERLGWGWLGAAHPLAALPDAHWGRAPRALAQLGVTSAAVHAALRSASHQIPPEPSDEGPIYWWEHRSTD